MNHPMTRKQLWRRQTKPKVSEREQHNFLFRNGISEKICNHRDMVLRTQSLPDTVGTFSFYGLGQHVFATTGNLFGMVDQNQSLPYRKKVSFRNTVKVLMIPDRAEYRSIDVIKDMWWEDTDYSAFKKSAIVELKGIMALKNFDAKQAQEALYQPGFHVELDLNDVTIGTTPSIVTPIPPHSLIFGEADIVKTQKVLSPSTNARNGDCEDQQDTNNGVSTI